MMDVGKKEVGAVVEYKLFSYQFNKDKFKVKPIIKKNRE